jgi:hypothetical protein
VRRTRRTPHRLAARVGISVLVLVLATGLAAFVVKWAPELLARQGLSGKDEAEELGRVRTALLALLAGVLAAMGAYYTHRTFELNRAGQITERFTRAIDQLGSSQIDIRLGGIYGLERVARDSSDDHPQVFEVLTAYVRQRARSVLGPQGASADATRDTRRWELAPDVQAVMSVLARRSSSYDRPEAPFDLARTNLAGLILPGVELPGTSFHGANLEGAILNDADLRGADLSGASLHGVDLNDADLEGAVLPEADLQNASFEEANIQGAVLDSANLRGANLMRADLRGATLVKSDLRGALLDGANLEGACLEEPLLDDARITTSTRWPRSVDPVALGARLALDSEDG